MASAAAPATGTPRRRNPLSLVKLNGPPMFSRSVLANHFSRTVDRLAVTSNFPKLAAFLPQNLWPWVSNYIKYAFHRRYHPFPGYPSGANTGVYPLARRRPESAAMIIAIAGDWGTGTQESATIAGLMTKLRLSTTCPTLTIHLGDVYYVGDAPEIAENCFAQPTPEFAGVKWPHVAPAAASR